ncbi:hypothetical protein [Bradyrhizobium iriomotense]|uniref:Uncharacterized protein n=1 Tax=Bradyrhizobium iriomotense TaxID=441950 RepID=A0ABQ6BB55_9BRAD|nr:hypothetical protein [Bradyrhizobium iriomotense]GLR90930.1 hypothetical protein GCM10007857_76460 [Bradyrhizobium iriomotense]
MRFSVLAIATLGLTPFSALAADCRVMGQPSGFGVDMTAFFAVKSGETCKFPIRIPGMMTSSGISQKPERGTVRQINVTTFTYTAPRGYKGSDHFAI